MSEKIPEYRLAHIGIHASGNDEAAQVAARLAYILDLPDDDDNFIRTFVGDMIEVKKNLNLGSKGHIGIETDDVDAAMEHLKSKGIGFVERTIGRDEEGRATFAYLDLEVAGFGIHLQRTKGL